MLLFLRNLLISNGFKLSDEKLDRPNQRIQNEPRANKTFRGISMSQARVLSEKELRKVLAYCLTKPHAARNRCMLLMTHMSGMRCKEVAELRICDVLATDGTIKDEIALAASQTKGDKGRTVLVPKKLQQELLAYLQQRFGAACLQAVTLTDTTRALFPTQKNPKRGFSPNTLCQLLHYIYKGAKVDGASSHSGRRSFLTKLADKGVGVRVLMALAGHKQLQTTLRYIELNPTVMKAAVELI